MNTNELKRERISAFIDGELDEAATEIALADLRDQEGRADWDLYHQIGDVLRSDELALRMSDDFSERFAARLAAEPTIVAPAAPRRSARRNLRLAAGAVAVAALAFVVTVPIIDALQPEPSAPAIAGAPADAAAGEVVLTATPEGVILRDPRIDDYLFAHQRFSPSVQPGIEHARNANFSGK